MFKRPIWSQHIENTWKKTNLIWLSGVRRVGKTTLVKSLNLDITFINCDLPSSLARLENIESFYRELRTPYLVFDEIHKLDDPSNILKIGTDEFPQIKMIATGSSKLQAAEKFSDTLTGRKRNIHLTPVLFEELETFDHIPLSQRLINGGLPPALLSESLDEEFYAEWVDSYFARDIQELFRVEKRSGFLNLLRLLFRKSGDQIDITELGKLSELSRPTVGNYLQMFETTHVITILKPFSGGSLREIVGQPKIYCFDTGFVCFAKGIKTLYDDIKGVLWEHLVLETLQSLTSRFLIQYWRDKSQREIDFVIQQDEKNIHAIECKWNPKSFDPKNLIHFREIYKNGLNLIVCPGIEHGYTRKAGDIEYQVISPQELKKYF